MLETFEPETDEVEEKVVVSEGVDEEVIDEDEGVLLLIVRVTVELTMEDDEAAEDPDEDVREADEDMELGPDDTLETEDVGPGDCKPTAVPSTRSVSTMATATIA